MKELIDLRIVKTKQFLRDALLELILENGFESITVKNLTERAQINRSTFYAHYYDKYDLLERTIDEMLLSFAEEVAPKSVEELTEANIPKAFFLRAFQYIHKHARFFTVMMGKNGIPSFQRQMLQIISQFMEDRLEKFHPQLDKMAVPKAFFISYVAHANLGIISYWLENDLKYSPQYMAEQLTNMTVEGPFSVAKLK
ncbi:MAG TPA: TetR/AcrR family transcriptional regulator [Pseudogracilibacillus sp.]|nr:TetR/AcrR family transcriptional regulator [Pseudogracilibacillus sp.]